jgi:hypothetical protein
MLPAYPYVFALRPAECVGVFRSHQRASALRERPESLRTKANKKLLTLVTVTHAQISHAADNGRQIYGSPRIPAALRAEGVGLPPSDCPPYA